MLSIKWNMWDLSSHVYEETRKLLRGFLEDVINYILVKAGEQKRSTVTSLDLIEALKLQGEHN